MSVQCHACIGGTNVGEDIRKLDYGQHVVSGTPGRVFGKQDGEIIFASLFRKFGTIYCGTMKQCGWRHLGTTLSIIHLSVLLFVCQALLLLAPHAFRGTLVSYRRTSACTFVSSYI